MRIISIVPSSRKGRAPRKGKGKRMQKAKHCSVCLTKKWTTSKMWNCCMREKIEGWRRVWGWVHCPQVSIIHACVLVVTRRAGVQRQGGRGCAQCNLVEDREVCAAINTAVQAQMELEGQEPPAHLTRVEPKKM
jgi:hypothetical protein